MKRVVNLQLAAQEILLALEELVQDAPDAVNLLEVALLGRGNVLGMELVEPNTLAVVRTLYGC